jgi:hypothetical protein
MKDHDAYITSKNIGMLTNGYGSFSPVSDSFQVKYKNISISCCYLQQFMEKAHRILVVCVGEGAGFYIHPESNMTETFYDIIGIQSLTIPEGILNML